MTASLLRVRMPPLAGTAHLALTKRLHALFHCLETHGCGNVLRTGGQPLREVESMVEMTLNTELIALGILLLAVLALALMSENIGVV
jgi:hypothetical protein